MKKIPKEMTICFLDVLLMPQGEIIHRGKTLGWFKGMREYLTVKTCENPAELLEACKVILNACENSTAPSHTVNRIQKIVKYAIEKAEK